MRDVELFRTIVAGYHRQPKGILVYPNAELRIESWRDPVGDHEIASQLLQEKFDAAGLTPSMDWSRDLFPTPPNIVDETFVADKDIQQSYAVVKTEKGLQIVNPEGLAMKNLSPPAQQATAA